MGLNEFVKLAEQQLLIGSTFGKYVSWKNITKNFVKRKHCQQFHVKEQQKKFQ